MIMLHRIVANLALAVLLLPTVVSDVAAQIFDERLSLESQESIKGPQLNQASIPVKGAKALTKIAIRNDGNSARFHFSDGSNFLISRAESGGTNFVADGEMREFARSERVMRSSQSIPDFFSTMELAGLGQRNNNDIFGLTKSLAKIDQLGCEDQWSCMPQPSWMDCALSPVCSSLVGGFWEDLKAELQAYFSNGTAAFMAFLGASYGVTLEALTASLLELGVLADIITVWGFYGVAVGVVFIGGYAVGTVLYNTFGEIIWRSWDP